MGRETEVFNRSIRLDALYDEWNRVATGGGTSLLWTDGKELNFIRAKIARYIEELNAEGYEEITEGRELPDIMDETYMHDAENLLSQAQETLAIYRANEDYRYLAENVPALSMSELDCLGTRLEKLLGKIRKFADAVEQKDLVCCKRYFDKEKYLAGFKRCREEVELNIEELAPF